MPRTITLNLPEEIAEQVERIAVFTHKEFEEVVLTLISNTVTELPLNALSDQKFVGLSDLQDKSSQSESFMDFLAQDLHEDERTKNQLDKLLEAEDISDRFLMWNLSRHLKRIGINLEELKDFEEESEAFKKISTFADEILPVMINECVEGTLSNLYLQASRLICERHFKKTKFRAKIQELWGKPLILLEIFLVISLETGSDINKRCNRVGSKERNYTMDVLTRLHARSCQVSFEILTLLKNGYADGAYARWRTLHEINVVAHFIHKHGEEVAERYLLHEIPESYRIASQYQEYAERINYEFISDEEFQEIKTAKEQLIQRFGDNFYKEYGWASEALSKKQPSFPDIAKDVNLDHLFPFYKMASHNVHAGVKSIRFHLGSKELQLPGRKMLPIGSSYTGLADPGHATAISLSQITICLLSTTVSFESVVTSSLLEKLVTSIGEEFLKVHSQIEDTV
jgi:Family of unknown function (DUF5677)